MAPQSCLNCSAETVGRYCQTCGQKAIDPDRLTLRGFLHDFAREALALDFATFRTLRALAVPGLLTREYLEGRRRPYLSPLKVYLLCAAIFFLSAPVAGFTLDNLTRRDTSGLIEKLTSARMTARNIARPLFEERFDLRVQTVYTFGLAISVAAASLLLALLFRRQRRPLGAHVVFALHYVAFLYLAAVVVGFATMTFSLHQGLSFGFAYLLIGPYLVLALRRVYCEPFGRILAKAAAVAVVTLLIDITVNAAAFLLTLMLV